MREEAARQYVGHCKVPGRRFVRAAALNRRVEIRFVPAEKRAQSAYAKASQ